MPPAEKVDEANDVMRAVCGNESRDDECDGARRRSRSGDFSIVCVGDEPS